jgi:tetratricopeptide (TPR) repeat protein
LAYATAARDPACTNDTAIAFAIQYLTRAVEIYHQEDPITLVNEFGFRAYYQLGLTYSIDEQYKQALEAFSEAISVATPETDVEEEWQTLRWVVYNQRGYVNFRLAEAGEENRYSDALADYDAVLAAYRSQRYGDPLVVAEAAKNAGLVSEALGQPHAARAYYESVLSIPDAPEDYVSFAETRLKTLDTGSTNEND